MDQSGHLAAAARPSEVDMSQIDLGAPPDLRKARRLNLAPLANIAVLIGIVFVATPCASLAWIGVGRSSTIPTSGWWPNPAMDMVRTASWNPSLFLYPSGLIYVERSIIEVLHQINPTVSLATGTGGGYAGLASRSAANGLLEQFPYFYAGRAFVALVGALMVLPTYFAARQVARIPLAA